MTSFIAIFSPPEAEPNNGYAKEMEELLGAYNDITGSSVQTEQIWGLTGIYTPYGIDANGNPSNKSLTLKDGWVAGDRVVTYTPTQYNGATTIDAGKLGYTVNYDSAQKLYYYVDHGEDLGDITDGTVSTPHTGTLYTDVTMDVTKKSDMFFTIGNKQQMENGTFFYQFTGYRYCFQALSDFYYTESTPISHTDSSLSLIWYQYTSDSGISGQMVLAGSDSGVNYITAQQICTSFNSANYTSKFTMQFNGIEMSIYIKLSAYAITHGYSVTDCYNNGYWSVLVTSPMASTSSGGGSNSSFDSFDPQRVFDIVIGLLSFHSEDYGLTGIAGTLAGTVFSLSLYTSLIAIGLTFWPVLLIAGIIAILQTSLITDWWPF